MDEILTGSVADTLETLCIANLAEKYCSLCASGIACCSGSNGLYVPSAFCAERPQELNLTSEITHIKSSDYTVKSFVENKVRNAIDDPLSSSSTSEDSNDEEIIEESEMNDKGEAFPTRTRRKHLKIDLSKDEELTESEIINKLLLPLENSLCDGPLEVILEIVGEEDEGCEGSVSNLDMLESLKEKLEKWSFLKSVPMIILPDQVENESTYLAERESILPSSYQRANLLISDIQNCFVDTANIVENILSSIASTGGKMSRIPIKQNYEGVTQDDILIQKQWNKPQVDQHDNNPEASMHEYTVYNKSAYKNQDTEKVTCSPHVDSDNDFEDGPLRFWENWKLTFEKDVDELFKDCYQLSSIEPSTSLESCLRNLQNLCLQLKIVKENVLRELIAAHSPSSTNCNNIFMSDENVDKINLINNLIDDKLKDRIKPRIALPNAPMIGLEGKTHKLIAEVIANPHFFENECGPWKENGSFTNNKNNYAENLSPKDSNDSAFETNSEPSSKSNSNELICSESIISSKSSCGMVGDGDASTSENWATSDRDGTTSSLSYEEALALHEDNEELQNSLLSILQSLNEIHNNFLRRKELQEPVTDSDSTLTPSDTSHNAYLPIRFWVDSRWIAGGKLSDDFDSIKKILQVSDELRHLWLFHTKDLHIETCKPTRTLSLNRQFYRPQIIKSYDKLFDGCWSDQWLSSVDKSSSMPDLNRCEHMEYLHTIKIESADIYYAENVTNPKESVNDDKNEGSLSSGISTTEALKQNRFSAAQNLDLSGKDPSECMRS